MCDSISSICGGAFGGYLAPAQPRSDNQVNCPINEGDPLVWFEDCEGGQIGALRRCYCGRFTTRGKLSINALGWLRFSGWRCVRHGEISPAYVRF